MPCLRFIKYLCKVLSLLIIELSTCSYFIIDKGTSCF
nr:MAG TPA: hypothetical protein [Crassvirales sp.]